MNVKGLLKALGALRGIVAAAGAKKAAEGVRTLEGLFQEGDERPVDQALGELRDILASEKLAARETYLKRLVDAGSDEAAFNAVHLELDKNKGISKEDADAIAHSFTGGRKSWRNRKGALDAIRKKFNERSYQEGKMRIVEKYKVS